MTTDPRALIAAADTALGIEFGSTRIKAVLIGPDHEVLATGGHAWENHLEGGLWSYTLDEAVAGFSGRGLAVCWGAAVSTVVVSRFPNNLACSSP